MAVVKILSFGGMVPAVDDHLLPDTAAALSQNCYLYTGQLVGIVAPKFIRNMENMSYGKAFRIPKNYYDAEHIEDAYWMEFISIDTDVVRSPTVDDQFDRYYWVSPLEQPQVNSLARIIAGQPSYQVGRAAVDDATGYLLNHGRRRCERNPVLCHDMGDGVQGRRPADPAGGWYWQE